MHYIYIYICIYIYIYIYMYVGRTAVVPLRGRPPDRSFDAIDTAGPVYIYTRVGVGVASGYK